MGNMRWLVIGVGAAALVGMFVLLRPDADPSPTGGSSPTPEITSTAIPEASPTGETPGPTATPSPGLDAFEIEVEEGRVEGPEQITVALGDRVAIEVESDVADHVHVHTYDVLRDIPAGRTVTISFKATIPGVFEIELEDAGVLLTRLEVTA
jgi:hypothetical protein